MMGITYVISALHFRDTADQLFRPSIKSSLNRTYLISPTVTGRDTNNLGLTTLDTQSTLTPVAVGLGPACSR